MRLYVWYQIETGDGHRFPAVFALAKSREQAVETALEAFDAYPENVQEEIAAQLQARDAFIADSSFADYVSEGELTI